MTHLNSLLARVTLLPLRLTLAISHGFGWLVLFLGRWLSVIGVGFAAVWLVLGLIYFILIITGVVPAFEGFGFSQWWVVFYTSLLSPLAWLLVALSPLAWTSYIILTDAGMSRLALGAFGVALSCFVLWAFFKIAKEVLFPKKVARQYRAAGKPPGPII